MSRLIHFEIHAEDPEATVEFYEALLGWSFCAWDGPLEYWTVVTGPDDQPGINGGLMRRRGPGPSDGQPVNAFVCTVAIDDLDQTVSQALDLGAVEAVPKMAIPGVGWLAYIKDPAGNLLGLMQNDPAAA